ncbi:hypothetical protein [Actinomadura macra]|uniref:hypothetical protein n=1 Tax=Actinomadura macra TaxID=46164 RepID=UPI000836CF11|nr:hypothetical protein [Actinomadura macra]
MTTRRILVMTGGALAPVLLLTLLFNNQWVVDAIRKSDLEYDHGIGRLVSWFEYPQWRLTGGSTHAPGKFIVAVDIGTLLFFVLLALLVLAACRAIDPQRGLFGAVVAGWWATVVAGGLSGIFLGALINWALDLPGEENSTTIWNTMSHGASYGLVYGWLPGIGALVGFLFTRPRQYAQQQPMPVQTLPPSGPVPSGAPGHSGAHLLPGMHPQPGAPMQPGQMQPGQMQPGQMQPGQMQHGVPMAPPQHGGQGLSPQHPAAVPYVPPPGPQQPQQPQWGGTPVPPQVPQFPGASVPPQPGQGFQQAPPQQPFQQSFQEPPAPASPPPAAQAPPLPVPEPAPPADDRAEPAEPSRSAEPAERPEPEPEAETRADQPEDETSDGEARMDAGPEDDDRPLPPPR